MSNESPITPDHGLVFAELADEPTPGNEREPARPDADGNAKPAEELGYLDLIFGDCGEDGQPVPDDNPEGRLA